MCNQAVACRNKKHSSGIRMTGDQSEQVTTLMFSPKHYTHSEYLLYQRNTDRRLWCSATHKHGPEWKKEDWITNERPA